MADVIAHKADVIVTRGTPAATAAKGATTTIPIVVASMGDPVGTGLVASLARPEGNLTGLSLEGTTEFYGKYLDLLREIVPRLSAIAVISNLDSSSYPRKVVKYLGAIAQPRGVKVRAVDVSEPRRFADAFR